MWMHRIYPHRYTGTDYRLPISSLKTSLRTATKKGVKVTPKKLMNYRANSPSTSVGVPSVDVSDLRCEYEICFSFKSADTTAAINGRLYHQVFAPFFKE